MFKTTSFPIILVLIGAISCVPYNNYVFESFWLGSICEFQECLTNQTQNISTTWWNIHGLWPGYQTGWPQYCNNNSQYIPGSIDPVLFDQMQKLWIGMNESNDMFHTHEWTKHGTCWNDQVNFVSQTQKQNDFFGTVVTLALNYDFYQTLQKGGIVPSEDPYDLSDFNTVLTSAWGPNTFTYDCLEGLDGNQYLLDLNICLDLEYNPAPCPPLDVTTCVDSPIYYLPISI
jgi:ribonuclease T2